MEARSLPSLSDLFKKSWNTFYKSLFNVFIFTLIGLAVFAVLSILAVIIFALVGVSAVSLLSGGNGTFPPLQGSAIIIASILGLVLICAYLVVAIAWQIGMVIIFSKGGEKVSFKAIINQSLKLVWPLFLVQLLIFLLVFGGFFVLVIPGIVISLLLSFAIYIIIFENTRGLDALRRSIAIIWPNFWSIILRLLLISVLSWIILAVIKDAKILVFLFQILWSWFTTAYSLTLYQEAKHAVGAETKSKLLWVTIISLVGWIIAFALGVITIQALPTLLKNVTAPQNYTTPPFDQTWPMPSVPPINTNFPTE